VRPLYVSASGAELGLRNAWATIRRHARIILAAPLVLATLVVTMTLLKSRTYTAAASFMPRSSADQRMSMLGGLAAQFGVNVNTGDPSQSPDFYADLLLSRAILKQVVETSYTTTDDGRAVQKTLVALLDASGSTPARRVEAAIRKLRGKVSVSKNLKTGVITLRVTTRWPDLSRQVAQTFLDRVNTFNLMSKQQRGSADQAFAQERMDSLMLELNRAEDRLAEFERRNRQWQDSPTLAVDHERLSRAVSIHQQIVVSFSQLYEQTRIEATRSTPVITVVETPESPALPDPRMLVLKTLLALVLGGVGAVVTALALDWYRQIRRESASPAVAVSP